MPREVLRLESRSEESLCDRPPDRGSWRQAACPVLGSSARNHSFLMLQCLFIPVSFVHTNTNFQAYDSHKSDTSISIMLITSGMWPASKWVALPNPTLQLQGSYLGDGSHSRCLSWCVLFQQVPARIQFWLGAPVPHCRDRQVSRYAGAQIREKAVRQNVTEGDAAAGVGL